MLNKQQANALGLIFLFLTSSNAVPDPQDCMQPVLGLDEIAIKDALNAANGQIANVSPLPPLGGTQDDGANITAALAKTGPVVLQRGATYNIATPIDFSASPGATLYGNGAIATGAMARTGGTANSVILATPTLRGSGNTTLNGTPAVGTRTLVVNSGAGLANGDFFQVQSQSGTQLTAYYQVISGGTTANIVIDRPLQEPFVSGDTVKPVSVMPRHVNVIGPLTINGNGDNGVSLVGTRRGYLRDIYVDVENAASGAACLTGGIDLDLGSFAVVGEDCLANGFNLASNTDQFTIGLGMASCESCRFVRSAGRHATTAGIFVTSGYSCVLSQCEGTNCGGTAAGIAFSGTSATGSSSTDCVAENCYAGDVPFGLGVSLATRLTVRTITVENCSTRCLDIGTAGTASTDCLFSNVKVNGGAPGTAAILIDAAVVRGNFENVEVQGITGTASLFNCSSNIKLRGFTADATNTTTGNGILLAGSGDNFISDVNITMKTAAAATNGINCNFTGRYYLKNIFVAVGVANDVAIAQSGGGVVELDDVMVTNPGSVGGTSGIAVSGATSVTRRKGRIDFSATATPFTLQQSDQGTFASNNNVAVDVTFRDIRAGAFIGLTLFTPGGTPAFGHTLTITGATKFTFTGTNLDTSTYEYKILD